MASSTLQSGLAETLPAASGKRPEKSAAPESNLKPLRSQWCAAPPGALCASRTATLLPVLRTAAPGVGEILAGSRAQAGRVGQERR